MLKLESLWNFNFLEKIILQIYKIKKPEKY